MRCRETNGEAEGKEGRRRVYWLGVQIKEVRWRREEEKAAVRALRLHFPQRQRLHQEKSRQSGIKDGLCG